jgi:hypothetical protein
MIRSRQDASDPVESGYECGTRTPNDTWPVHTLGVPTRPGYAPDSAQRMVSPTFRYCRSVRECQGGSFVRLSSCLDQAQRTSLTPFSRSAWTPLHTVVTTCFYFRQKYRCKLAALTGIKGHMTGLSKSRNLSCSKITVLGDVRRTPSN